MITIDQLKKVPLDDDKPYSVLVDVRCKTDFHRDGEKKDGDKWSIDEIEVKDGKYPKNIKIWNTDPNVLKMLAGEQAVANYVVATSYTNKAGKKDCRSYTGQSISSLEDWVKEHGEIAMEDAPEAPSLNKSSGGSPVKQSGSMTNDEQKAEVEKIQGFLCHLMEDLLVRFPSDQPMSIEVLQKLAVTTYLTCKDRGILPDYSPDFKEPTPQIDPEDPVDTSDHGEPEVDVPKFSDAQVAKMRAKVAEDPMRLVKCTDCQTEIFLRDLTITNAGALCITCADDIPF